ncbi:hypothetical protein HGRIS_002119 [Hohenbuehelia grisea]|uniref:HECT-type E3 ubiquitin transferase n=1 Tax=Hohenbuehelia grisea TaxID=104357 RepID=A0ABR3JLF7_9AGAR
MRIFHKSKRAVPPHPQVTALISSLLNTPNEQLANFLADIDAWKWPRSDLNAWLKVLNKFDAILEDAIRDYKLDDLQMESFAPETKSLICEVLRFERLLLENSTNRKMFSSYDRLNSLLCTEDLDVLILSLNLLLRPAQQYSNQPSVTHALNISTPRLQSLSKRWPYLREQAVNLVELATSAGTSQVDALPSEARQVNFSFYRTDTAAGSNEKKMETDIFEQVPQAEATPVSTPRKPTGVSMMGSASSAGPVNIHIDEATLAAKPVMHVLKDTVEASSIPESEKYELLCRIRAAAVLSAGNQADREKLVIVRLLAIAIYGHTHPETQASSSLFLFEPDLITHIAELLQADREIPLSVQTAALAALDAFVRYRGKAQEILTAVNAGVNHGILMALVRKTVADVAAPASTVPQPFVEALLAFITYITTHAAGGNMVVGAGLVPLLIQLMENRLPNRLPMVSKTMQLIDNVLYNYANAFQLFCGARGVEVLVDRIEFEVDHDIVSHGDEVGSRDASGSYGELPVARAAVLKHSLRSLHRMMQSSGTAEGLRGLIDMSILKSIKKIMEHRGLFGPSVFPIAINIMSTFIHNEPTSLATIQEVGLPDAFYNAIEFGLEGAIEVIQAIPNAIGALCLNEAGQNQLAGRPSIIPSIFSIFTSERHLKMLLEKENAVLIGTAVDELVRHHPSLKKSVFDALQATMAKIEDMGWAWNGETAKGSESGNKAAADDKWYRLVKIESEDAEANVSDVDVVMQDVQETKDVAAGDVETGIEEAVDETKGDELGLGEQPGRTSHDNIIVSFIDVLGRFLEGLFQHIPHCRDFISVTDGLNRLGRLTALPCLPYDFANSVASDSMVQVMRSLTDVATGETLLYLTKLVKESLDETESFWGTVGGQSKLLPLVEVHAGQEEEANRQFRSLVTLHIRITLLSDVFATAGYSHGRAAISLLQTLMSNTAPQIVAGLGTLHRASIAENILFKAGLTERGIDLPATTPNPSPLMGTPSQTPSALPEMDGVGAGGATMNGVRPESIDPASAPAAGLPLGDRQVDGVAGSSSTNALLTPSQLGAAEGSAKKEGPREQNATALKHLAHGLPASLSPFFQALVKMFHARRNPDAAQKKQIAESSQVVAKILLGHASQGDIGDKPASYSYYSVVLGLITTLLVDERTTTNTLHTVPLHALYRAGGFDSIFAVCQKFMTSIEGITKLRAEDRTDAQKQELIHAFGGLKVALHLIHPLISSKPLFESGQTLLIITPDQKDTDPSYFEPHNFLVKLRLAALPTLQALWQAPWLLQTPLAVSRPVVQTVLELTNGENEEAKDVTTGAEGFTMQPAGLTRPAPDENRIRQLTDMGFPRSAAERALLRTHNNVTAATELLLAQPFPLPPDPEPAAPVVPNPEVEALVDALTAAAGHVGAVDSDADTDIVEDEDAEGSPIATDPAEPTTTAIPEATPAEPQPVGKTPQEWRKELDDAREPLKASLAQKALSLVDEHAQLIPDLRVAFIRSNDHQKAAIRALIEDVKDFSPHAYDVQEQSLANRCQLLAFVLFESPTAMEQKLRVSLMEKLLALLLSNPIGADAGHPALPKWLGAHLLLTETLLTLSEEPRSITLPKKDDPIPSEDLFAGPSVGNARSVVFEFCLRLLAIPTLPNIELASILRLFVLLTRDHDIAAQFVKRDGTAMLLARMRSEAAHGCASYMIIILRHVVEDSSVVQHIMKQSIKRYFAQPRSRVMDIGNYARNCSAMSLRDPKVFIETTESLCMLAHPFSASPHISLKPEPQPADKTSPVVDPPNVASGDMQVDPAIHVAASSRPSESAEAIVHALVAELLRAGKEPVSTDISSDKENTQANEATDAQKEERSQYQCLLMQCLTELLFSYEACKLAFLSYPPKKRTQTPSKESGAKHRATVLHYLLTDLISSSSSINAQTDSGARERTALSNWAMSVIVALCVDMTSPYEMKDISLDLVSARKFVLEAISRAIKDGPASESVEARYGRLLALSDLCYRLLTVRVNPNPRKAQDETPTHIAKIMLEKNFVATLTNALAEVDLNYPNVKGLVAAILRPLEHLTKIAIKMSRTSGKGKDLPDGKATSVRSYMSEDDDDDDDEDDADREETPDLYRNSALGMYGGEMEDVNYNAEGDIDEDEEDEDEDVDMEYGDETGSEDTSNTDDDGEEDELEDATHAASEPWDDEEDEDEDLVENEDGHDDEDGEDGEDNEDEGDEDDDADDEMMWPDFQDGPPAPLAVGDEGDDEDRVVSVPIMHEEEDDHDMSEDGEYGELAIMQTARGGNAEEFFGFMDFTQAIPHDEPHGLFVPRRRGGGNENTIFGRPQNAQSPPAEVTTHPLLLDHSAGSSRPMAAPSRHIRHPQRVIATSQGDLVHTIEGLIGEGAFQLFQHIMTRGRGGGGPETIRLDVPSGTVININRHGDGNHTRRAQFGLMTTRMERVTRQGEPRPQANSLEPVLTVQRWAEEAKILNGEFVSERSGRLGNHIALKLLPAAIEAKRKEDEQMAKLKEERAKAEEEAEAKAKVEAEAKAKAEADEAEKSRLEAESEATKEAEASATAGASANVAPESAPSEDQQMDLAANAPSDQDAEMADATQVPVPAPESGDAETSNLSSGTAPSSAAEAQEAQPSSFTSQPESSNPPARVTVMIHGSAVDITDTGIDPDFLEALPDDMREEVLNQHVRDQQAARVERPPDSQISSEFLDALPPEIRAEIIQQERVEQARRRSDNTGPTRAPAEMDPASFIASLDPQLRQVVLMDQDDGFLQTLPSHMIAEAGAYRDTTNAAPPQHLPTPNRAVPLPHDPDQGGSSSRKPPTHHDAIQLLDKAGIAVLVRLLFFPQVLKKNTLFKVLVNLCENAKTRTDLFNLLLSILQDGSGDLAAVDKSFAQMSVKNTKPQTPKAAGKQKSGSDYLTATSLSHLQNDAVPELIAQRCLEGLTYIVSTNEVSSLFFLTENELPAGLRRSVSRKGKGKEKQVPQTHYPIVLLLGLLDRQSLLKTPSIMESVVSLLSTVTRPLASLKDKPPTPPAPVTESAPAIPATAPSAPLELTGGSSTTNAAAVQSSSDVPSLTIDSNVPPSTLPPLESMLPPAPGSAGNPPIPADTSRKDGSDAEPAEEKALLPNPPVIPHAVLRLIVNILTIGECSGRTFQQSLALIQHLSYIPDARDVIAHELKTKAQDFGQSLYADLDELAKALQESHNDVLVSSVAAKFSAASSIQAKLLRVLKTIDYMYSSKSAGLADTEGSGDADKVQGIYESFRFTPLWQRLGDCLSIIEDKSDVEHIATVLLPLIEALMVVCKHVGPKSSTMSSRLNRVPASPKSPTTPSESMEDLFVSFTDAHRKVLNLMVRNNPSLMSGSFSLLVHNPRVLDFDNKRNYFTQQLHRRPHAREHHGTLQLNVRRARVFEDSFQYLQRKTGDQIKYGKLSVRFYDEEGVDAGGVTREWFQILARQMFDPNNALFQPCAADRLTYQPNKNSWVNPEHLSFFKFVGRVIGKAIYDGRLLDAYFARSLYRQILNKPVDYKDVEWVDPEYYNSLCWILENDPTLLELTFSVEADEFGVNRIVPLKENGESIPVTLENRKEFVQLSAQYRLYSSIKDQIEALLAGFYEIIPKDLISIFNEQELELLISGTPDIDVDEWRAATEYNGYSSSDPAIVWWWRALKSFNREERAKVLSFATGTSKVPLGGFMELQGVQGVQRFSIHRAYGEPDRLPQAHTCFNQVDLPQYSSYEMLRQQTLLAITEGGEGFAFA